MPAPRPPSSPESDLLSCRLDREWAALRRRRAALERVGAWALTPGPVTDLDAVLAAAGYRQPATRARNEVLHRLVERARSDDLAARIVLQRILPGLLAVVRHRRARFDADDVFEELIGAAWIVIRLGRVTPASQHVAATLISASAHRAFVAPARRRSTTEVMTDPGRFGEHADRSDLSPFEELAALVREAREHGLPPEDLELVRALVRLESTTAVAAARKVTARTVRNHRDRAVYGIRRRTQVDPAAA
jgi:hypothetical protein